MSYVCIHCGKSSEDPAFARKLDEIERAIHHMEKLIMATLSEAFNTYATDQAAFNASQKADLDAISTKIDGLNTLITQLQTSAGTVTPEDQATIDKLEAAGKDLVASADALAGKAPPAPVTPAA